MSFGATDPFTAIMDPARFFPATTTAPAVGPTVAAATPQAKPVTAPAAAAAPAKLPAAVDPNKAGADKVQVYIKDMEDVNKLTDAMVKQVSGTVKQVTDARTQIYNALVELAKKKEPANVNKDAAKKAEMSPWVIGGIGVGVVAAGLLLWLLIKRR